MLTPYQAQTQEGKYSVRGQLLQASQVHNKMFDLLLVVPLPFKY